VTTAGRAAHLFVPPARLERWTANFAARHGATATSVVDGVLAGTAEDGSTFAARLPFGRAYDGPPTVEDFVPAAVPPADWGLLLVRKGGFAVARLAGARQVESKVGQRHVQGRSKAGGWSQQRFARRRDQQARVAYEAAAGHARRLLAGVPVLVTGGDRAGVEVVLDLAGLADRVVADLPDVGEPRRGVLEDALADAGSVRMAVTNA
jgi:hypothetical protein